MSDFHGHMDENPDGTLRLVVTDKWGWRITLTGTRDPNGGFVLDGQLGDPPASLRVPAIDDEK